MANSYHVHGPIAPQFPFGAANALTAIGTAQDGADITITPLVHGIKSDQGGGMDGAPVENIFLNAIATIRFRLVPFDGTFVTKLRALSIASATDGTLVTPGTLYGGGSFYTACYLPLGIAGEEADGPWYFPVVRVVRPGDNRVWTKETTPEIELQAFVYVPPTTASINTGVLYQRSAPS